MPPRPNAEATGQPAWVLGRGCHQETLQPSTALCSFCASAFKVGSDLCLIPKDGIGRVYAAYQLDTASEPWRHPRGGKLSVPVCLQL